MVCFCYHSDLLKRPRPFSPDRWTAPNAYKNDAWLTELHLQPFAELTEISDILVTLSNFIKLWTPWKSPLPITVNYKTALTNCFPTATQKHIELRMSYPPNSIYSDPLNLPRSPMPHPHLIPTTKLKMMLITNFALSQLSLSRE